MELRPPLVPQRQGGARREMELRQGSADVILDGSLRKGELPRDGGIAHPLGDERRHFGLSGGEHQVSLARPEQRAGLVDERRQAQPPRQFEGAVSVLTASA